MVLFDVTFPDGAKGLQMREIQVENRSPPQFAPYPAFKLDQAISPALGKDALGKDALAMCYGSERPHLLAFNGVSSFPGQCNTLSGGMAVTAWPTESSPTGVAGAVWHGARFSTGNLHSRMLLSFTPLLHLKRCMRLTNCIPLGWPLPLTGSHCKFRPNTEGLQPTSSISIFIRSWTAAVPLTLTPRTATVGGLLSTGLLSRKRLAACTLTVAAAHTHLQPQPQQQLRRCGCTVYLVKSALSLLAGSKG
jgi:hypothetical protein